MYGSLEGCAVYGDLDCMLVYFWPFTVFLNDFVFQTLREYKGETLFLFLTSSTSSASVINWEARTRARTRHLTSLADLTHPFVDKWEQIPAVAISQKTGGSHGRILKTGVHFRIYTLQCSYFCYATVIAL